MFKICSSAALAQHSVRHSDTTAPNSNQPSLNGTTAHDHDPGMGGKGRDLERHTISRTIEQSPSVSQIPFSRVERSVVILGGGAASRKPPGFISIPRVAIIGPRGGPRKRRDAHTWTSTHVQIGNNSPRGSHELTEVQTLRCSERSP